MSLNACVRVVYEFVYVFPYPSDPLISRLTYPSIVGCQRLCIKLFFYCVNPDRIKQIEFGKNINLVFFSTNNWAYLVSPIHCLNPNNLFIGGQS